MNDYISHDQQAFSILRGAIELYRASQVYACFSGGLDSLCATLIAAQHPFFKGCLHIDTGIGIPETTIYVTETCKAQGWPLTVITPPSRTYEDLVLKYGFPGPAAHRFMYRYLKERPLRAFIKQAKKHRSEKIILVTGVRRQESLRRMGNVQEHQVNGAIVWVAPLLYWSKFETNAYARAHQVQVNLVVEKLGMSGECLCGAFARPNEINEIEECYPDVALRIHQLEAQVKVAGKPCVWGQRPKRISRLPLFDDMMMCDSCLNPPVVMDEL